MLKRRSLTLVLLFSTCTLLSGCSKLCTRKVAPKALVQSAGESAAGLSYYLGKPVFRVDQLATTGGGKEATPEYRVSAGFVADQTARYEVGLHSGWFTSDVFEVNLTDDGRLGSVNASITDQSPEYIKALGELVVSAIGFGAMSTADDFNTAVQEAVDSHDLSNVERRALVAAYLKFKEGEDLSPKELDKVKAIFERKRKGSTVADNLVKQRVNKATGLLKGGISGNEDPCGKQVDEIFRKQVVAAGEWSSLTTFISTVKAKSSTPAASAQKKLSGYFKELKRKIDLGIAAYISNPKLASAPEGLGRNLAEYRKAVAKVLEVDDKLNSRALKTRRDKLIEYLKKDIPTPLPVGDNSVQWYIQLRAELEAIDAIVAKVVGGSSPSPVITGTELTRTYDDLEVIYLRASIVAHYRDNPERLLRLGEAYWRFGIPDSKKSSGTEGVIFYYPAKQ